MFIMYMNFVLLRIQVGVSCKIIAYADDTSLLFDVNPESLSSEFDRVSEKVGDPIDIFTKFGLKVNESKTDAILFRASRRKIGPPKIRLGNCNIEPSRSVKCLGVVLHERCTQLGTPCAVPQSQALRSRGYAPPTPCCGNSV